MSELNSIIKGPQRKLIVSSDVVDLSDLSKGNVIYVILIADTPGAAGGRAAGFGQRTIERVLCFQIENKSCKKVLDLRDEVVLSTLDLPVGIARMPAIMVDGTEEMLYGVVDPDSVEEYNKMLLK